MPLRDPRPLVLDCLVRFLERPARCLASFTGLLDLESCGWSFPFLLRAWTLLLLVIHGRILSLSPFEFILSFATWSCTPHYRLR